ncbi:class I SAM-dependent methyltransferase [Olivibacter sp. CPCC 100613]|uniref:class I SAM-dependent methyltransferase n=1 Tax=Olivibacter sp. CPCC 100613 TaxID=3079931 RepID=UPI002FF9598B
MEQELIQTIVDFFKDNERQGPGCEEATLRALGLVGDSNYFEHILDIGCGTGAQTMILAQKTNAQVFAVDLLADFLEVLKERATWWGVQDRITTHKAAMEDLPFQKEFFDVIWSEGAIYHIGFEKGLRQWRELLKRRGYLVVSEISWMSKERPRDLTDYWTTSYPEIDLVSNKMKLIEDCGYFPIGCFALPDVGWDNYYHPVIKQIALSIGQVLTGSIKKSFLETIIEELVIYQRYREFYNYVFYVMQKK